jgi:tetratricopeptide (TPR) repeat protein
MARRTARAAAGAPPSGARDRAAAFLLVLALLAAALAYVPGLDSPYVFDDERYVRDNPTLRRVWPPGWIHAGTQETRPAANLSFALDVAAFGPGSRGHHVVNLGLHLLSALLLFLLARRMLWAASGAAARGATLVAAVAAALLALHPVQSGSVLYIQGRPGLLSTAFSLAAALAALAAIRGWARRGRRVAPAALATVLTALAALSKESAAALPALVLLADLTGAAGGERGTLRERLVRLHLPLWLALLPLGLVYATLQNPHGGVFGPGTVDAARFYATQPLVLLLYLRLTLWPAGLAVDRVMPLRSFAEPQVWIAALVLLALVALVVRSWRRSPWVAFWAAWWLAAVAPTSLVPNREFVAERYLTAATPAAAALAAWGLVRLARWLAPRLRLAPRALTLALAFALALPLGWATHGRAWVWRSDLALWHEATRVSPGNARAWYQVGRLLYADGATGAAEAAVRRSVELGGPDLRKYLLLSDIALTNGDVDSSVAFAAAAVELAPRKPWAHAGLARVLARAGRWAEARAVAERALAIDPTTRAALYLRGWVRGESGDLAGAETDAATLDARGDAPVEAAALRGLAAARDGRVAEAERWLTRAMSATPAEQDEALAVLDAMRAHAFLLADAGRLEEAVESWTHYLDMADARRWDAASMSGLAGALRALGRVREADSVSRLARAAGAR